MILTAHSKRELYGLCCLQVGLTNEIRIDLERKSIK